MPENFRNKQKGYLYSNYEGIYPEHSEESAGVSANQPKTFQKQLKILTSNMTEHYTPYVLHLIEAIDVGICRFMIDVGRAIYYFW